MNYFTKDNEADKQITKIYSLIRAGNSDNEIADKLTSLGMTNLETKTEWIEQDVSSVAKQFKLKSKSPLFLSKESKEPITRTFKGSLSVTTANADSASKRLQSEGYKPTTSNYEQGQWGTSAFSIIAILLSFIIAILLSFIIGKLLSFVLIIIVFLYMIIVKPEGTLTVIYEKKEQDKICPMCAESVKPAAAICRFCNYDFA